MKPSFFKSCLASLLFILLAQASLADMYVDRSIVIFEPDAPPREDVKVSNTGDEVIYVQVDVFSVDNAGSEQEKLSKVTDPKDLKLIATPNKMIIPAGGQKLIRIVNLEASNQEERIYRINVTPIVAPLSDETSQLRIVVAYQILTIIQPDSPKATLVAQRDGKVVTFRNNGNSNILLSEGNQCKSLGSTDCNELPSHRLYAGNSWNLDLPYDAPLSYSMKTFSGIKKQMVE